MSPGNLAVALRSTWPSRPDMTHAPGRSADLRHALRSTVKEAVWLTTSHHPGAINDVALFAARRGGSTWMMHVIAAAPNFRSLDQPFSVMTANLTPGHYRRIPKYTHGEIVRPAPEDLQALHRYVESLLAGEIPINAPYRFWRRDFRRRTTRQVLKIVGAKDLICWISDEFDVDVVLCTRHPITQAMSCIRNGWTLTARSYLDSPRFVDENLDAALEAGCHDVLNNGSPLDRFVLNWGLEHLTPLRALPKRPDWIATSYEATVLRPEQVVERLADRLDLGPTGPLLDSIRRPSRSSRLSTASRRRAMRAGDEVALLHKPLFGVHLDDRRKAMTILEKLGLEQYKPDEIEPVFTS